MIILKNDNFLRTMKMDLGPFGNKVFIYASTVKRHNLIIGSKHTTLGQWDDLLGSKIHVLHNRMTSSLYQGIEKQAICLWFLPTLHGPPGN